MSTASPETINKITEAAKQMGINIINLAKYAKEAKLNIKGINGLADVVKRVVAIAHGKEGEALTEEVVHIATAMIEQTNPKLITELISKIDRFKIYKQVLDVYKNDKNYQLENGKPDIRKIKKEAVDKLIAEVIVNNSENEEQFPELREETNRNIIQKWWETIKDYIRGIYRKSNIGIFEEVGKQILEGKVSTEKELEGGIYLQKKNDKVDAIYDVIVDKDNRLELHPESVNDKRHYTFDGEKVAKSVTEKVKENQHMPERTPEQKKFDDVKKDWGIEGHKFIENYITLNLIDKDGYIRETPLTNEIETPLSEGQQEAISNFAKSLIYSYKEGTRILVERKVVNERVKGKLASTMDFLAIEP